MKNGTTTRIIDRCIQELFKNGFTFVYDGRGNDGQLGEIFLKMQRRLEMEHPKAKYIYNRINVDGINCFKFETHDL